MKAMVFSIIRMITAVFVLALMFLTLVLYIGIEGLPKSNKLNKEKEVN